MSVLCREGFTGSAYLEKHLELLRPRPIVFSKIVNMLSKAKMKCCYSSVKAMIEHGRYLPLIMAMRRRSENTLSFVSYLYNHLGFSARRTMATNKSQSSHKSCNFVTRLEKMRKAIAIEAKVVKITNKVAATFRSSGIILEIARTVFLRKVLNREPKSDFRGAT